MTTKAGTYGLLKNGANTIANLKDVNMDHSIEIQDVSVLGTVGYRSKRPTFKDWSMSATGYWDPDDTLGQVALETAMIAGTQVTVKFYPSATSGTPTTGDVYYTGNGYITGYPINTSFENLVEISLTIEGDGALTRGVEV